MVFEPNGFDDRSINRINEWKKVFNMTVTQQEQDAIREARRQYHAEWRRKNPDKIKAANDRYWLKKAKEYEQARHKEEEQP